MNSLLRVLIVEDSEDDALLLIRQLRRGGYDPVFKRVDTPAGMQEALLEDEWDIVISDYAMPLFSAFAALDLLKRHDLDLPFIIVSGAIGEEIAVAAMKSGAHDYMMKDNVRRLIPAIARELREARVRRERRRALTALQESEERYRSLVDNLDLGIALIDPDFTVIMANAARNKICGEASPNAIGSKCFRAWQQSDAVCSDCPAACAMTSGQVAEVDREVLEPDGKHRIFRVRAFPTFDSSDKVTGCIEVVEDITERRHLEQQLRQAAQLEAIGRLAGGVAHDFNNLLTAMMAYSEVVLQHMATHDPNRDKVVQITHAAERAAVLTRQLLTFGRKQVLDVKVIDLNAVISDLAKMLRRLVGEDVELVTEYDTEVGKVKADRNQIEQVVMNLAINARDAMPRGGTLRMETANVVLDEEYCRTHLQVEEGRYVHFTVTDTGIGMDPATVSRIFDPFFTTKEAGKGTGLGLSMVYGIVQQHKGHLDVQSEAGRGTTFHVYLPTCHEAEEEILLTRGPEPRRGGHETVLVVEDEAIVRNVACEVLEMLGYTVLSAADPEAAINISEKFPGPIHLLVADVVLPRMDAGSLYAYIEKARPDMKVLYVSGYPEASFASSGVLNPGVAFLTKPFTFETLSAKVREVLDETSPAGDSQAC
jgi:two-component system, cell cycle sensor histidine kinase and response regulator CckA